MKKLWMLATLAWSAGTAFAQTASSGAQSGAMAVGGGAVSGTVGSNTNRNVARGGAVIVNLGSTDSTPSSQQPATQQAQSVPATGTSNTTTLHEDVQTVGNPGSMSYGVSFSQYNCANTAGVGAGFLGGAFQLGIGHESDPCNARANAAALFSIAQTLATANPSLSAQLYHAAILLIGNSTGATRDALAAAGVSDWAPAAAPAPAIVPPAAPMPDQGKASPPAPAQPPAMANDGVEIGAPIQDDAQASPLLQNESDVKALMYSQPAKVSSAH